MGLFALLTAPPAFLAAGFFGRFFSKLNLQIILQKQTKNVSARPASDQLIKKIKIYIKLTETLLLVFQLFLFKTKIETIIRLI
jgi:hypothetical protein